MIRTSGRWTVSLNCIFNTPCNVHLFSSGVYRCMYMCVCLCRPYFQLLWLRQVLVDPLRDPQGPNSAVALPDQHRPTSDWRLAQWHGKRFESMAYFSYMYILCLCLCVDLGLAQRQCCNDNCAGHWRPAATANQWCDPNSERPH